MGTDLQKDISRLSSKHSVSGKTQGTSLLAAYLSLSPSHTNTRTHTCTKQRKILTKSQCTIHSPNKKERNVDSMFFPLKCNSSPPSRAVVPITIELFCLCRQLLNASAWPPSQNQFCMLTSWNFSIYKP